MKNNPFSSNTFKNIWLKHFNKYKPSYKFNFIKELTFIKTKFLPLYINVGKNNTNGISYNLSDSMIHTDYKNKVFLIYDVPTYFNIDTQILGTKLKFKSVDQYQGVLTNFEGYKTFDDFLLFKFKSKNRYNLKKKIKQLESNFNISYSIYDENISDKKYFFLSEHMKNLITKRFKTRKENNPSLDKWSYYTDLMLPLLREKKAVIVTVNNNDIPIGMAFNFLSDDVLFYAIPTFDVDYMNFNIGHSTIMEIMKWCFDNKIRTFDFSKGIGEYKNRWVTNTYVFQNHILYDSGSITSSITAQSIFIYFKLKQFLRDKNVNVLFSKLKYLLGKRYLQTVCLF